VPEKCPETLNDAIALLRQRDRELERVGLQLTQAREELEETNRGLIALYSELQEARKAEARFATVVQSSSDAVISLSLDGAIETWNPGATYVLGHSESDMVGGQLCVVMPPDSRVMFEQSLEGIRRGDHPLPYDTQWSRSDDSLIDVSVTVFGLQGVRGDLIGFCAVARDITIQMAAQRQLEQMARFDALTGLVNRTEIVARLRAALKDRRNPGLHLGVLFCDIDHFKEINDTWGHSVGDLVLTAVADRIGECVREVDTVGRMGGDEILVLLPGLHSLNEAAQIAEKIRCRAAEPIHRAGHVIHATLSIGAALAAPGESVSAITARADIAMYEAKRMGRNTVIQIAQDGSFR